MSDNLEITVITSENKEFFRDILFEPRPLRDEVISALGVRNDGIPCATAVLSLHSKHVHLHSVYVEKANRKQGIGSMLFDYVRKYALEKGCEVLTANYMHSDEGMEDFLLSEGFLLTGEPPVYVLSTEEILQKGRPEVLKKNVDLAGLRTFSKRDQKLEKIVSHFLEERDFPSEILEASDFDRALSSCILDNNGMVRAVMLCTSSPESIMVEFLMSSEGQPKKLVGILSNFYDEMEKPVNAGKTIVFQDKHENAVELVEKILDTTLTPEDFPVFGVCPLISG